MKKLTISLILIFALALVNLTLNPHDSYADMGRGAQNYQAIMKGVKKIEQLTPEELQEVLIIHRIMSGSGEGCGAGYSKCVDSCESETSYFDYESGDYRSLSNTDYASNCKDACRRGRNYCEDEDKDERCYEFKRACARDCPSDVFDYSSGEYKLITDVDSICEDACRDGERACD